MFYRRESFKSHLNESYSIRDETIVRAKSQGCRIGRNCQSRFWRGFCRKLVEFRKRGLEAWNERFDHIGDHIEKEGRKSYNWMPIDYRVMERVSGGTAANSSIA